MDFAEELKVQIDRNVAILRSGIDVGRAEGRIDIEQVREALILVRSALRTVVAARDLSPDSHIPTPLLAAIEAARKYA